MPPLIKVIFSAIGPRTLEEFRAQCRDPMRVQRDLLRQILLTNAQAAYGIDHGFSSVGSFEEFQRAVPIASYEDLSPYINQSMQGESAQLTAATPVLYATTSGTTGTSKFIPVTKDSKAAKSRQMRIWLSGLFRDFPAIAEYKVLTMVSPKPIPDFLVEKLGSNRRVLSSLDMPGPSSATSMRIFFNIGS